MLGVIHQVCYPGFCLWGLQHVIDCVTTPQRARGLGLQQGALTRISIIYIYQRICHQIILRRTVIA